MPIVQTMAILAIKPIMRRTTPRIIKGLLTCRRRLVMAGVAEPMPAGFHFPLNPATRSRKPPESANPITRTDYDPVHWLAVLSQPRRPDLAWAQLTTARTSPGVVGGAHTSSARC